MPDQPRLDFDTPEAADAQMTQKGGPEVPEDPQLVRDRTARTLATDPSRNVALEASAGTGKTRVLVDRYVRLVVEAGVHPRHILAMTFTRKAAAEMRQRVLATLKARHREGALAGARWRAVRDAFPEITISTIDAFCLSLLHEFPLEAGVDPAFDLADETETPRLVNAVIDRALRIGRSVAATDEDIALVFADLGEPALRRGLAALLDRRLVAAPALARFLRGRVTTTAEACARLHDTLRQGLGAQPGGLAAFLASGPLTPGFTLLAAELPPVMADALPPQRLRAALERLSAHVLTAEEAPRQRLSQRKADFRTGADYERHKAQVLALGPGVAGALSTFRRDLNVVMARGAQRLFAIASAEYRRALEKHGVLDFSDVLERTLALLEQRDEFSRSRFKLESRYRHVLVDEFQDTSRAQWRLVRELMSAWSEGAGAADDRVPPSIFIVGDRKQSIYGFRDAEVAVLEEAARHIDALRPEQPARAAITRSYRAVEPLLRLVNDVCDGLAKRPERPDAFRYSDDDRFPVVGPATGETAVGLIAAGSESGQAEALADEIARLLNDGVTVRDRATGLHRPIAPGDVAVLFRTRDGHRLLEQALAARAVPFYVYKGLGFFDADEIRDVLALLAALADKASALRAAAVLRSRFVRVSDEALKRLAPDLAGALWSDAPLPETLAADDALRLQLARASVTRWQRWVDRLPPADLLDRVLAEAAYARELAGPGRAQATENLKKIRGLVRRLQNRGYATLERVVEHFSQLVAGGDESNAIVDAVDAVNLMTVHAAKGLEFPVVFIVNLSRPGGGGRDPIRVVAPQGEEDASAEPMVGIGDHETEADADAAAREAEESKRLLYVALTRARDRLYLAGVLDGAGTLAAAKGSLAQHLPAALLGAFGAGVASAMVTWTGPSSVHLLRVVPQPGDAVRWGGAPQEPPPQAYDVAALEADAVPRVVVADGAARARPVVAGDEAMETAPQARPDGADGGDAPSDAALGTFVHALVAEAHRRHLSDGPAIRRLAEQLPAAGGASGAAMDRAVSMAAALLSRDELASRRGSTTFEAPYSRRLAGGTVERGTIDCLIAEAETVLVLELKTGARHPAHAAQLEAYVAAVAAAWPSRRVEGRVLYASGD